MALSKCTSKGTITLSGTGSKVGGLIGTLNAVDISNCKSNSNIIFGAGVSDAGGFIGLLDGGDASCTLENCYATGNVTGSSDATGIGGFIGHLKATWGNAHALINCYSVGVIVISGGDPTVIGGFAGILYKDENDSSYSITNCSWFKSAFSCAIGNDSYNGTSILLADYSYGTDEVDNLNFYPKTHTVYDQIGANPWDFDTPIWYEWTDDYPQFIPQPITPSTVAAIMAKVLSIGVMPRVKKYDQLWAITERVINGRTCRFVEYMNDDPIFPERDDYWSGDTAEDKAADDLRWRNAMFEAQKKYVHMDAALTYDGSLYGTDAVAALTPGELTGNSITFTTDADVFDTTMVGRQLWKQAQDGVGSGRAEIITYVNAREVVCNILSDFDTVDEMPAGKWYLTTDKVSGAWHLEGATVKVLADGGEHPEQVVADGEISIQYQASVIHIGLGYMGLVKSMHLDSGSPQVPSQAREMNVNRVGVKFLNTLGARYGTDLYKMQDFKFSQPSDLMGRPSPLFSEHLVVPVEDVSAYEKHFYIQQIRPLPCTIEDLTPFVEFAEQ